MRDLQAERKTMKWEDKLKEHEAILKELYYAIGNTGHGKLTVLFAGNSNKIEIIPEPYIRDAAEYNKFKTSLK